MSKFNLLEEPSPLGLSLRKSPSLQELIQMRLSQSGDDTNSCVKKESMSIGVGTGEKLKASNFPATVLRIGQWEVSLSNFVFFYWSFVFWNLSLTFVCSISQGMKVIWWLNVTLQNINLYGKCWNKVLRARLRFSGLILWL